MNYASFFGRSVSKPIVGDNPFNGHSIGVFQRDKDELSEDVALYEEWRRERRG